MFWLYRIFSVQVVSNLIGVIEIVVALLIAVRPISAGLSFIGRMGAVITFALPLSFSYRPLERSNSHTDFRCWAIQANSLPKISVHRFGLPQNAR
jgi:hypothetical protein